MSLLFCLCVCFCDYFLCSISLLLLSDSLSCVLNMCAINVIVHLLHKTAGKVTPDVTSNYFLLNINYTAF